MALMDLLAQMVVQRHRRAGNAGVFAQHHIHGDGGQIRIEAAFVFKAVAEGRCFEIVDKARDDAAAQIHAAARAQCERQIGGDGAEHGAENVQC